MEEQRVRALVARQAIALNLQGLPFEHAPTVTDVLMPKIRRSELNEKVNPSHLDLTTCWKGLTHSQSTELAMWYHFLHRSLHAEVRMRLRESLIGDLLQSEEPVNEVYLVPRIFDYLRSAPSHRLINISFVNLIDNMLSMFHEKKFRETVASTSSGSQFFDGGLSRFLHYFLHMQDCFLDGQYLAVEFGFEYTQYLIRANGKVTWQPPDVRFLALPERLSPGEEYRITPFMSRDSLGVQQVKYALPRSSLNFCWDSPKQRFRAIVPDYADEDVHIAETVLKATLTTPFPRDVRFERECRWVIRLEIAPAKSGCEPMRAFAGNTKGLGYSLELDDELQEIIRQANRNAGHYSDLRRYVENTLPACLSLQKKKVSGPRVSSQTCHPKRRRHEYAKDCEDESWNYAHDAASTPLNAYQDSACPLIPSAAVADSGIPATKAVKAATHPDALQQQQIMRNYEEFAGRKSRRDAGLASPVSDGERTVFESIFLHGDDVWSPATEGSALDFESAAAGEA
ncbi:hypothetical protein G6514_010181 [Epicoccum nigrum]|nr:hypothetical protein G6514_010181 [Epicoccum nigrum]